MRLAIKATGEKYWGPKSRSGVIGRSLAAVFDWADVCAWMKWVVGFEGRFGVEDAVMKVMLLCIR